MPPLPTSEELQRSLWSDLLDRWFPACIDPAGGYRQNFDADFRPTGDATKSLVFQSRMVWVCATVAAERPEYAAYARHGLRFLLDRMRRGDAFAWSVDASGPTTDEVHAYGLSFALYGLAAVARHLGDIEAHEAAERTVDYLESVHRDPEHGGFFEVSVAGKPVLDADRRHAIGRSCALKSQNTHLHLMEAYTERYRAAPQANVRETLGELVDILANRLFAPTPDGGHLTLFAHADWTPASTDVSYGHDIEAAHLLLDAEDALRAPSSFFRGARVPHDEEAQRAENEEGVGGGARTLVTARALADATLARGYDAEHGGIFYAGDAQGPTDRTKNWWANAEALLGFATLWKQTGDPRYRDALAQTWAFIKDHQIDRERGGWFEEAGRPEKPKGHAWKAAYHDGRALLFTARLLDAERL